MASLRNLTIGILRRHGHRNIAAALRRNARDATRVLPLLGSQAREPDTPGFAEAMGPAYQRHGPGRKARGHAERHRSGPVPSRPSPSGPHHWRGGSVVFALDPDRANAM
jgi:hypothetical protein